MATPSVFPMFMKAQSGGTGSGFLLTDNVDFEFMLEPDVEIVEVYDVEVVDETSDVEIVEVVDIELDC